MKSVFELLMSVPRLATVVERLERAILTIARRPSVPPPAVSERTTEAREPAALPTASLMLDPTDQPIVSVEPTAWPTARARLNSDHYDAIAPENLGQEWLLRATDSTRSTWQADDQELSEIDPEETGGFHYEETEIDRVSDAPAPDGTHAYRTDTGEVTRGPAEPLK